MQRSKWYALVFLLGAFVAGAALGYAAERAMGHGRPDRHGSRSPLDRMSRDLDLTPQQRAAFDTILENREKQMRQLFAPIQPQMGRRAVRSSTAGRAGGRGPRCGGS